MMPQEARLIELENKKRLKRIQFMVYIVGFALGGVVTLLAAFARNYSWMYFGFGAMIGGCASYIYSYHQYVKLDGEIEHLKAVTYAVPPFPKELETLKTERESVFHFEIKPRSTGFSYLKEKEERARAKRRQCIVAFGLGLVFIVISVLTIIISAAAYYETGWEVYLLLGAIAWIGIFISIIIAIVGLVGWIYYGSQCSEAHEDSVKHRNRPPLPPS